MIYGNKLSQYKRTNVETASGIELVVMCYEHAIRFLREAKEHYENEEYLEKGRALQRALDIINELKCSLDFDRGGEIANNLDSIYNFLIKSLLHADIQRDLHIFDSVSEILSELKEAWESIIHKSLPSEQGQQDFDGSGLDKPLTIHGGVAV